MELLKLSKFKLQLHALISEVRELKEKERNASQQIQISVQKQKQSEEEFNEKLAELRAELGFSNELRHKLERKVTCLENENNLLESKQKELEGTLQSLLESREAFLKAYEDSTYEMKRSIEDRDRKIDILSEKLRAHLLLFDSMSKEASSINKLMDDARHTLSQKEDVVVGLKRKMDEVSTFEKLFVEKINNLENKLMNNEVELTIKAKRIRQLEAELEAAILSKEFQPKITQLQREISTKELLLQNLISENKGLHCEVGSLGIFIKRIQDAVTRMGEEDRKTFTSLMEGQEECLSIRQSENLRIPDIAQITGKDTNPKSSTIEESTGSYHALALCY
ncbi:PREDICTED: cingulin isoform X4 [Nicotiana attenuata]|uniref:cingulin isoform X4 n=1 Tax=Nicotiana attenuata TaxID=49451 RepID=UPI000905AA09|nr:PREDICTED: cingulin isoform X4 [Nicotiana attenuata]